MWHNLVQLMYSVPGPEHRYRHFCALVSERHGFHSPVKFVLHAHQYRYMFIHSNYVDLMKTVVNLSTSIYVRWSEHKVAPLSEVVGSQYTHQRQVVCSRNHNWVRHTEQWM